MRAFNLSLMLGLSTLLLGVLPLEAHGQRVHMLQSPVAPGMMAGTVHSFFTPIGVVSPSRTQANFYNVTNPFTGVSSTVPRGYLETLPTLSYLSNAIPAFSQSSLASQNLLRNVNYYQTYGLPANFYGRNLAMNPYSPSMMAYSNPYMMYSSPYMSTSYGGGGYGGGGYGGGSYGGGGYGGGNMSSAMYSGSYANPYATYTSPYTPAYTASTPTPSTNKFVDVAIFDNRSEPKSITISAGTTVRWTNDGLAPHTVTSEAGLWDSGDMTPGSTTSYTFTQPGKYTYRSTRDQSIRGTVIVQ